MNRHITITIIPILLILAQAIFADYTLYLKDDRAIPFPFLVPLKDTPYLKDGSEIEDAEIVEINDSLQQSDTSKDINQNVDQNNDQNVQVIAGRQAQLLATLSGTPTALTHTASPAA
jgi:hypothetical protein